MKKFYMFLMILTLGWLESVSGQSIKYPPVRPYNLEGYVVEDFQKFALEPTEYSRNFQKRLLSYVNRFLRQTGLDEKYGEQEGDEGIKWIFSPSRTWEENRKYNGFSNTHKNGNQVSPYWDKRSFEGSIMVLHVDGYELDLAKTICMNLVDVQFHSPVSEKKEEKDRSSEKSTETRKTYDSDIVLPGDDGGSDDVDLGDLNPKDNPSSGKTEVKIGPIVISVGILAIIAGLLLLKKDHGQGIDPPPNNGGGGGVIIPPVDTGGPGIDSPPNGG